MAGVIAKAYKGRGYVVEGLSLSGMGAESLQADAGIESMTIHKKIWEWGQGRNLLNDKSVLIVDNASMVGTRQAEKLLAHAEKAHAKVVMFGQEQFLQSIDAGGAYRALRERAAMARATLARNDFSFSWQHEALDLFNGDTVDAGKALDLFAEHGAISHHRDNVAESLVGDWLTDVRSAKTYKNRIMLAYTNADVGQLNALARDRLKELGYIDLADVTVKTAEKGELGFSGGDRIMFLRKDNDLGVQSGSLGTLRSIEKEHLHIKLDRGASITVDTRLYNDLDHGYAATVYRSAGMKAENTYILASRHFNKHATQAALQCHARRVRLYHNFINHQDLKAHLTRSADKDLAADYPVESQAYQITVQPLEGRAYTKFIVMKPEINQERLKKRISRMAHDFAAKAAGRLRLSEAQAKQMTIKVDQVPMEQYRQFEKSKPQKGRGRDFER